jgi:hypothetical protein
MNHLLPPLLLADLGEVIGSLVGLFLLVLWVIGQLTEGKKQMGRPPMPRPAAPPAPPQRPVAAQPGAKPQVVDRPGQAGGGLRGEVEDFLRRAGAQQGAGQPGQANRPAAAQRKPQPAQGEKIEVLVDEQGRMIERRRPAELTRPAEPRMPAASSAQRPLAAKPAPPSPPRRLVAAAKHESVVKPESVAEHVRQHIDSATRALGQQASQLGQRIVREDAQFDVQLKAKFDHEVGTLAPKERVTDTPSQSPVNTDTTSPAAQLAAMLTNPEGVRQAVIINEVLRRPSERW